MRNRFIATLSTVIVTAIALAATAVAETALDESFDSDAGGFTYLDDTFRSTAEPNYASGVYLASGGYSGGGLRVTLGGVDANPITDMSGGWSQGFTVAAAGPFELTFRYSLTQSARSWFRSTARPWLARAPTTSWRPTAVAEWRLRRAGSLPQSIWER